MRRPPKHLGEHGKKFWLRTLKEYRFSDEHEFQRLADAARTRDTVQECIETLDKEGIIFLDRWKKPRQHVAVKIMHDAQALFCRIVRELGLDLSDEESRPPRRY